MHICSGADLIFLLALTCALHVSQPLMTRLHGESGVDVSQIQRGGSNYDSLRKAYPGGCVLGQNSPTELLTGMLESFA